MVKTSGSRTLTVEQGSRDALRFDPEEMMIEDVLAVIRGAIEDKKGENVRILDLEEQVDYLDYVI
jgi:hypothetical protein